jgi:hypothetical protein
MAIVLRGEACQQPDGELPIWCVELVGTKPKSRTSRAWQHPLAPLFSMFPPDLNLNPAINVGPR